MKNIEINFKEVKFSDLEGNTYLLPEGYAKELSNIIYTSARSIDVAELGVKIFHAWKSNDVLLINVEEMGILLQSCQSIKILGYPAHMALKSYLDIKQTEF